MAILFCKRQNRCRLPDVTTEPIFVFQHYYECQATAVNLNGFVVARCLVGSDVLQVVDVGSDRLPQELTSTYESFVCKAVLLRVNQHFSGVDLFRVQQSFCRISKGEVESNGLSLD
jgi:hypothetical protein